MLHVCVRNHFVFLLFFRTAKALVVDALADKRLYEQELTRMRRENAFLEDQASTHCVEHCRRAGSATVVAVDTVLAVSTTTVVAAA